jgi:hypothetical protein
VFPDATLGSVTSIVLSVVLAVSDCTKSPAATCYAAPVLRKPSASALAPFHRSRAAS